MVAFAEVQAGLQGNRLDGTPLDLVERALSIDPNFARALWLAGVAAYKSGDGDRALSYWHRLGQLKELDARSRAQVEQAMAQVGQGRAAPRKASAAASGASVAARIELAPELMEKTSPGDVVFVFARAAAGPRMPLAVQRLRVADLPRDIVLDDSMAMSPQMRLSAFDEVILAARVSRTGSATPSPGDLVGASAPVAVGSKETTTVRIAGVSE
jgi:cytochrome c-type biogenesis protein CcmH